MVSCAFLLYVYPKFKERVDTYDNSSELVCRGISVHFRTLIELHLTFLGVPLVIVDFSMPSAMNRPITASASLA